MRRRTLFGLLGTASLGMITRPVAADDGSTPNVEARDVLAEIDPDRIDPYFLDDGDIDETEQQAVESYLDYQSRLIDGRPAVMPRGGRPRRAPNYRFLHWRGELGDPQASLVGPLSLRPILDGAGPFRVNAQILGFHVSTADWSGKRGQGTLTIEFRGRNQGESMTWLYVEQFAVRKGGGTSVGLEYVAQRDGIPDPVVCEEPNVDVRIQLMRHRKSPGVLRKILKVGSFITGTPLPGAALGPTSFDESQPAVRVPRMLREGVAFAQATVGGMSDEAPIWRSGFNSFGLARGGSRLMLAPGFWVALDDSQQIDFATLKLVDLGGRVGLMQNDKPADLNYLVLAVEVST